MSSVTTYLESCQNCASQKELALSTFTFLADLFPDANFCLIRHQFGQELELIQDNKTNKSLAFWQEYIQSLDIQNRFATSEFFTSYVSAAGSKNAPFYIFAVRTADAGSLAEILSAWSSLSEVYKNITAASEEETSNEYGNLISQMLHDIQSLMELCQNGQENSALKAKLAYQRNLNKNLLFYIREFDLFKSFVGVQKFLTGSLALLELKESQFSIDYQDPEHELYVDVELFSKALNNIIQNAIDAVDRDFSNVQIRIYNKPAVGLTHKDGWVVIEVNDSGKGISPDFIPYITKPFFTTQKFNDHCGFGLSNAKKIISAHGGYLKIDSEKGTHVKIIIPNCKNEEE